MTMSRAGNNSGQRFCSDYGVRYPIACAGMAFVASIPELAIAVANAGGLPAVGAGIMPANRIEACVTAYRNAATAPLNLNFLTFAFDADKLALCTVLKPDIVSFHWGHPEKPWIEALHVAGIKVWEQVGTTQAAQIAIADGVDLVIVQGIEAGGHNYGELPLDKAITSVRNCLGPEPLLLAAGGISDGLDMARAMALGADGVMLGSRLVASIEANAHPLYKAALVASDGSNTLLTSIYGREMPFFNPVRVVANQAVVNEHSRKINSARPSAAFPVIGTIAASGQTVPIRQFDSIIPTRDVEGNIGQMMLLAGTGIGKICGVEPVFDIIADMMVQVGTS